MVLIPAGWYWMGSEGHYDWESPRHRVFIDAFLIAPTPVTRREYHRFIADTAHPEPRDWTNPLFQDPDQPVVGVSWFDAVTYCEWLSQNVSEQYRLPTEAEWEKACRGGRDGADYAWGNESPEGLNYFQTEWTSPRRVGEWQANGYGLFNFGENVHEWCSDWFRPSYYSESPGNNPTGPETGTRRVSRGGSWRHQVKASRCAHRSSLPPHYRYTDYGFRVAQSLEPRQAPDS